MKKCFITNLRLTRGDHIDGACGKLVVKIKKSIKGKKLIPHKSI
jgi:23S rRNA (adenine2503-C2)-methyltransferase